MIPVIPALYFYTPVFLSTTVWDIFWVVNTVINYVLNKTSLSYMSIGLIFILVQCIFYGILKITPSFTAYLLLSG
ncbi:hypothetical protein WA026_007884 [Henosepilachna vigintioctopunctata]|uniref:Uncharacterized protein n=1 Tax=Henosepilachna vigintioctopunctata TaxID=420089 RepID=A0AAW1U4B7_9CUCU